MTQTELILDYMKQGKEITALDALMQFGCLRLAARISDIKKQGHNISTRMVTSMDKHYAAYSMKGE